VDPKGVTEPFELASSVGDGYRDRVLESEVLQQALKGGLSDDRYSIGSRFRGFATKELGSLATNTFVALVTPPGCKPACERGFPILYAQGPYHR
jgi:hypothetical protein